MDDRHAYMLNELWTRQYDLGRILRFRQIQRGRQAICHEVLTAQQHTFTAYLYPPAIAPALIIRACETLILLDKERFSVVPMLQTNQQKWIADGPQGAALVVGLEATGQILLPDEWSLHDLTQLGLRLGWMHRLLLEQCPIEIPPPPAQALQSALTRLCGTAFPGGDSPRAIGSRATAFPGGASIPPDLLQNFAPLIADLPPATGWAHGDLQPAALLLDSDRQIRTLVDWTLLHPGNPLEDLIDTLLHWCTTADGTLKPPEARALLESYATLRPFTSNPWPHATLHWCLQRIIDHSLDHRPLPRNFPQILANPDSLVRQIKGSGTF